MSPFDWEKHSKALQHVQGIGVNDDFETPPDILTKICRELDFIPKLDVCATEKNTKCSYFITPEEDMFKQEFDSDFFMNPPYSKINEFMEYAYDQHIKHNLNALILTFAKTDTVWFEKYVSKPPEATVLFIRGRLNFWYNGKPYQFKNKKTGKMQDGYAPYPSAWIIWRTTT
jgi:phage N-6-adenine-methyltransferase